MSSEPVLHVFCDQYEWYVAASEDDARRLQRELTGCGPADQEDAQWEVLPDDSEIVIWHYEEEGFISEIGNGVPVLGACADWAVVYGEGFLCSTEF